TLAPLYDAEKKSGKAEMGISELKLYTIIIQITDTLAGIPRWRGQGVVFYEKKEKVIKKGILCASFRISCPRAAKTRYEYSAYSQPFFKAVTISSTVVLQPLFLSIFLRWVAAVAGLIQSRSAISLVFLFCASKCSISFSRQVSTSLRGINFFFGCTSI